VGKYGQKGVGTCAIILRTNCAPFSRKRKEGKYALVLDQLPTIREGALQTPCQGEQQIRKKRGKESKETGNASTYEKSLHQRGCMRNTVETRTPA